MKNSYTCILVIVDGAETQSDKTCGSIAQLGEHLPYKQRVTGSSPVVPTTYAGMAQLVEQLTCNQQVTGSSPVASTNII